MVKSQWNLAQSHRHLGDKALTRHNAFSKHILAQFKCMLIKSVQFGKNTFPLTIL